MPGPINPIKIVKQILLLTIVSVLLNGCIDSERIAYPSPIIANTPGEQLDVSTPTSPPLGMSADAISSLETLRRIDDYPLYTMEYKGSYLTGEFLDVKERSRTSMQFEVVWGCSLFAALADPHNGLFGRNFDWFFSPVLLLYTDPPDGYASMSVVDMAYLDLPKDAIFELTSLPIEKLSGLLDAPSLPFDGMNEYGLAVGMAAVPSGNMQPEPEKEDRGSLEIIREILDHARNIDEALAIFGRYNILMEEVPIHYLMASADGQSALIEYFQGEMIVTRSPELYQIATNFLVAGVGKDPVGNCWRFDQMEATLKANGGLLTVDSGFDLLSQVAQPNTQWSAVYSLNSLELHLALGGENQTVHHFGLFQQGE